MLTSDQLHSFFEIFQHSSLIRNPFQQLLNQTRDTTMMLQDLRAQLAPITASLNKSLWFSDDETNHSDHGTQTDGELSPLIIKPKKYNKKKSFSPLKLNLNVCLFVCLFIEPVPISYRKLTKLNSECEYGWYLQECTLSI